MATKYTVFVDETPTDFTRSKKETALEEAGRKFLELTPGQIVSVRTNAGTVVFEKARKAKRVIANPTKPFTRTTELNPEIAALVPEGYEAAYYRSRNHALVLRVDEPEDGLKYAVMDTLDGTIVEWVATCRDANPVQIRIGKAHRALASA